MGGWKVVMVVRDVDLKRWGEAEAGSLVLGLGIVRW